MKRYSSLLVAILLALPVFAQSAFAQTTLRQSTQRVVRIGPATEVANCTVPVTTLAVSSADEAELLKAAGAATVDISGATFAAITSADGWYDLTLTTSHTDTVGDLTVVINDDSLICPIFARFQVVEEAVFDACCAASAAPLTAGAVVDEWETQSQADPTGFHVNVMEIGGTAQTANDNGADINEILTDTGTTLQNEVDGIQADTEDLQARVPAALVGGRIDATVDGTGMEAGAVSAIETSWLASQRILTGTCDSGSTTTCVDDALTQADATQLDDRLICYDDSWCGMITTFAPGSDTVTTTKIAPSTRASKAYTIFPATLE